MCGVYLRVKKDNVGAAEYFRSGADQGIPPAMYGYGMCLFGAGDDGAARDYKMAAD